MQIGSSVSRPMMPLGAWSSSRIFFSGSVRRMIAGDDVQRAVAQPGEQGLDVVVRRAAAASS